jgi:hypothetical protein
MQSKFLGFAKVRLGTFRTRGIVSDHRTRSNLSTSKNNFSSLC